MKETHLALGPLGDLSRAGLTVKVNISSWMSWMSVSIATNERPDTLFGSSGSNAAIIYLQVRCTLQ